MHSLIPVRQLVTLTSLLAPLVQSLPAGVQLIGPPTPRQPAAPATSSDAPLVGPGASLKSSDGGCGTVSKYFGQTPQSWQAANTDAWLDRWWKDNSPSFEYRSGGFAAVFGEQYLGNPDWACKMDGSASNCDYNPCRDSGILEQAGASIEPAYYVIESINRFHAYFKGLSQALQVSGIFSALMTGSWVETFWMSPKRGDAALARIAAVVVITIVAVASAFFAVAAPILSAGLAAGASLFAGAYGIGLTVMKTPGDEKDVAAADVGKDLANTFLGGMKELIGGNDQLMAGNTFGDGGDIRQFIKNGTFVNFTGVNETLAIDWMNTMLMAKAVNSLWRKQKVFILGGGPCDAENPGHDKGTLGEGPKDGRLCRDGKAWYLYFWKERSGLVLNAEQWGWVDKPPGAENFGKDIYKGLSIPDVISSSLDAYAHAGYNYTDQMAHDRSLDALEQGWANPGALGPAWEGIWDIPVCDISDAVKNKIPDAEWILMNYGKGSRLHWCGNICSGDEQKTKDFIHAAQMDNFKSPKHYCPNNY